MKKKTAANKKRSNKTESVEERAERLSQLSHTIFEDSAEHGYNALDGVFNKFVTKYGEEVKGDDEKFTVIISPIAASLTSTLATFLYHMEYSLGDALEMMADFYKECEEVHRNMADEELGEDPSTVEELVGSVSFIPPSDDKSKMN